MKLRSKVIISITVTLVLIYIGIRSFVPTYIEKSRNTIVNHQPWPISAAAKRLHSKLLIGDWHSDSLLWQRDLMKRSDYGHVDVPRLIEGNVAFQSMTAVTKSPSGQNYHRNSDNSIDNITLLAFAQGWPVPTLVSLLERALYQVNQLKKLIAQKPDQLRLIANLEDVDWVINKRKQGEPAIGFLMGMEGAHPLQGELINLGRLWNAGYRMIGLQHFFDNELGGSLHGENDAGLTPFGKEVVRGAVSRQMILDLAHSSIQVVKDVLELTDVPVIISHTGIYGHCASPRNIPDELLQKIAMRGGVIGIGYWKDVICDSTPKAIVQSIRAGITLLGVDHISLGSDFDGSVDVPFDTSELAALTHEMLEQGFTEEEIYKVMGGNMIRLLKNTLPKRN